MEDIITFLENSEVGNTLYYPGAFEDSSPLELFAMNSSIKKFIYTDYCPQRPNVKEMLNQLDDWEILKYEHIEPDFFGQQHWNNFMPNFRMLKRLNINIGEGWGSKYLLINTMTKKEIEFIYLGTDGIETVNVLIPYGYKPDIIVLQDHGYGGNYSTFGLKENGEPSELSQYLAERGKLPTYLFASLGDATTIWPGYHQITDPIICKGALHQNERALFKITNV